METVEANGAVFQRLPNFLPLLEGKQNMPSSHHLYFPEEPFKAHVHNSPKVISARNPPPLQIREYKLKQHESTVYSDKRDSFPTIEHRNSEERKNSLKPIRNHKSERKPEKSPRAEIA
jgi:hypothetical protein